jgi:hypothetical protein
MFDLLLLLQGEQLAAGGLASPGSTVVLASSGGMLAHFAADNVRCSSRAAGSIKVSVVACRLLQSWVELCLIECAVAAVTLLGNACAGRTQLATSMSKVVLVFCQHRSSGSLQA